MRLFTGILIALLVLSFSGVAAAAEKKPGVPPVQYGTRGNLDCTSARTITCGETVSGDNSNGVNNVDHYSCSGWTESGPEEVWVLNLPGPDCWIVSVDIDPSGCDLDVFFLASCDEADCIDYGDSGFVTECLLPGTYYIVVDGYNGAECSYTLNVECETCECPEIPCCPTPFHCHIFDFNQSSNNYFSMACGGQPVWGWGMDQECIPAVACDGVQVTSILGTYLNSDYPSDAGEIAVIGPIFLDYCCWCMELCHFYDIEDRWDGGNVKISTDGGSTWQLITPAGGYDDTANDDCSCVPGEPVFTGWSGVFVRDCFDLTGYTGRQIWIGFFFGSDGSFEYCGWYPKWVKFGGYEPSATERSSWGSIKSQYR